MKILWRRLASEPRTDEEYVESVRRWLRHPGKSAVLSACQAVLLCVASLSLASLGLELVSRITASENLHWLAFALGMTLGTKAGFSLSLGVCLLLLEARTRDSGERRARRLTLEFHEKWKDRNGGSAAVLQGADEQAEVQGRKILGMRIVARRKTDEQYVEYLRKSMRRAKGWIVFQMSASVLLVVFSFIWLMFWVQALRIVGLGGSARGWQGFAAGVVWGIVTGLILSLALGPLERFATLIHGSRTERLMLRYYDGLGRGAVAESTSR